MGTSSCSAVVVLGGRGGYHRSHQVLASNRRKHVATRKKAQYLGGALERGNGLGLQAVSTVSSGVNDASLGAEGNETCLLWLKHDLRVLDNPGLVQAVAKSKHILPLYVFDPDLFSPYQESEADIEWLHEVLCSLKAKLKELGSDLLVRIGKAEDIVPEICVENPNINTIVTQKETNCLWIQKMDQVLSKSEAQLETYTYTLFGEKDQVYPMRFSEMKEWRKALPIDAPKQLSKEASLEDVDTSIPSPEAFYASMMECWRDTWEKDPQSKGISDASFPYKSTYCTLDLLSEVGASFSLSGQHDKVEDQLNRYFSAFQMSKSDAKGKKDGGLEDLALSLEVPGGFGQSFSVLFRKHLAHGVLSPGQIYRAAETFQAQFDDPLSEALLLLNVKLGSALRGVNAAKAAALKFDFTQNIHQHSLDKDSLLSMSNNDKTPDNSKTTTNITQKSWQWRGAHQEFIEASPSCSTSLGEEGEGEEKIVVLVHGFGAFGAHWRDNVTGLLSKGYRAFCPTLPGYGRSEKTSAQYTPQLWSEYVRDFITNVVKKPVVIAGNSIGGYISAYTSAKNPELIKGLILVNTAGRLVSPESQGTASSSQEPPSQLENVRKQVLAELGSRLIFLYLERSVPDLLKKAYTQFPERADEDLAREIERASSDPGAFDVFKSVFYLPSPVPLNDLLHQYNGPTLVFQGANDPLNDARARAKQMRDLYPNLEVELVEAGHCPHDEIPDKFNQSLDSFFMKVASGTSASASVQA